MSFPAVLWPMTVPPPAMVPGALASHVLCFFIVAFAIALVTSVLRWEDPGKIIGETARFFIFIVVGIFILAVVVFFLEWAFVRPLL